MGVLPEGGEGERDKSSTGAQLNKQTQTHRWCRFRRVSSPLDGTTNMYSFPRTIATALLIIVLKVHFSIRTHFLQ